MNTIDFNNVIAYSRSMCYEKSHSKCATYVKKAFERGGCKYIGGNGWNNQKWCESNNFVCIGDFVPIDKNPRAHNGIPMQWPNGYVQQTGDVCLIKHGIYGHICYAMGPGIDDWVSDYFQRPPAQQPGTGPYCYTNSVERVQFWRHKSVLNGAPTVREMPTPVYADLVDTVPESVSGSSSSNVMISTSQNRVSQLASATRIKENVTQLDESRKKEFESLINSMVSNSPQMGREILIPSEMYDSNILKGSQESKKERT
jgi:hypothetical protein